MNVEARDCVLLAALLPIAAALACRPAPSSAGGGESNLVTPQLQAELAVLRTGRILFSHHSVGGDVLAGIEQLDAEAGGGRLRIPRLNEVDVEGPGLMHVSGGQNKDPRSKIDFFAASIRSGQAKGTDLAMMKFCFVDFEPSTDVEALLSHYRTTIETLKRERPDIRFAHVTVPLFRRPVDVKSRVRRLVGLYVWEDAANVKRGEFNRRLAEAFPSDPLFDLARAEAVGPDGAVSTFEAAGREYLSLNPAYTTDGGHLNSSGRRAVGAAAIRFLAERLSDGRRTR